MKLNQWILLSLAVVVFSGCAGAVKNQVAESPSPATTTPTAPAAPSEPLAQSTNVAQSNVVRSGSFMSGEHPTQGTVRVITQNGKSFLELDQAFKTSSMGPDLVVILHRSSNVLGSTKPPAYPLKEGDYVLLAPLQKFTGAQRYAIPANVNLATYQSAAIWCRRFNATFGAATLTSQ